MFLQQCILKEMPLDYLQSQGIYKNDVFEDDVHVLIKKEYYNLTVFSWLWKKLILKLLNDSIELGKNLCLLGEISDVPCATYNFQESYIK